MKSINDQRILSYNSGSGVWTDLTKNLAEFHSETSAIQLSTTEYLYFGSFLPFNHKYFDVTTANATPADLSIEIFDGSGWVSVNEVYDYTDSSGVPYSQSGNIQFTINRNDSWSFVGDTSTNSYLTEFSTGPIIYDKYWARVSASVSISLTLRYVGHLFCVEQDLLDVYPALSSTTLLNSWETGKTDWLDQRITATEYVIQDLKRRNIIAERSQVVETSVLMEPAIHRTAHIIYNGLGPRNYAEEITTSGIYYRDSMNITKFEQDVSGNGQKDRIEQYITTHRASR